MYICSNEEALLNTIRMELMQGTRWFHIFEGDCTHTHHYKNHHQCSCRWLILVASHQCDGRSDDDYPWQGQAVGTPAGPMRVRHTHVGMTSLPVSSEVGQCQKGSVSCLTEPSKSFKSLRSWFTDLKHLLFCLLTFEKQQIGENKQAGPESLFENHPSLSR